MDSLTTALMKGLATDVLNQLQPALPVLRGNVIALSNYGKTMWDNNISWTTYAMSANFIRTQDSPFLPSEYGTVQILEEPRPVIVPIYTEGCKVSFNHAYVKKNERDGAIIDIYSSQLVAKAQAWDEKCADMITYGDPYAGIPGLLFGSGIPVINSTVNLTTDTAENIINEIVRLCLHVSVVTRYLFLPNLVSLPSDIYNILNTRSYSTQVPRSILSIIRERLAEAGGYENAPPFQITSVPQFAANKLMTVLPSDPDEIGAAIWELEEFYSPQNSESSSPSGKDAAMLGSAHEGAIAGCIAKRPNAGCIINLSYT